RFYFLETAARVAGAHIDKMIKAAAGIELWAEAARIELASIRGEPYQIPDYRNDSAGLIICLARQEYADMSSYQDPEIIWRMEKPYHAGMLLASPDSGRIESLLNSYNERFAQDFLHHLPGKEKEGARNTI
ncbi:MAG: ATPase, partial [Candidatus Promineifilaceae bacterium]